MTWVRAPVLLLAVLVAVAGCGGSSAAPTPSVSAAAGPVALVAGKAAEPLDPGPYLSPDGFVPALTIAVPAGWTSTHRGDDAFDLRRPGPKDAPLVVVALITPKDDVAATALTRLRTGLTGTVTTTTGTVAGQPATGFEVVGGSGSLVQSPSGTLELDATGHVVVLGTDVDGVPLLIVVQVPDPAQWATQHAAADALLAGITPA